MFESFRRFFQPFPLENLGLIALAAICSVSSVMKLSHPYKFVLASALAQMQWSRMGNTPALMESHHLAVLIAVGGAWLNIPIIDPIIGVLIGVSRLSGLHGRLSVKSFIA